MASVLAPVPQINDVVQGNKRLTVQWFDWLNTVRDFVLGGSTPTVPATAPIRRGNGAPNGSIIGSVGDVWLRLDGGAGTTLYVKEAGNQTDVGWTAK